MMPSVHRLATAETIPSFELLLQKFYIEIMPVRTRFFPSTLSCTEIQVHQAVIIVVD